eukprot:COSAG01_NODE_1414_length_10397_cov_8.813653_13_plen_129_part_01
MRPFTVALLPFFFPLVTSGGQPNKIDPPPPPPPQQSLPPQALNKGIYGPVDNRLDQSDPAVPAAMVAVGSQSTVALVAKQNLIYDAITNTWGAAAPARSLQVQYSLCAQDNGTTAPFADQLALSSCSGT